MVRMLCCEGIPGPSDRVDKAGERIWHAVICLHFGLSKEKENTSVRFTSWYTKCKRPCWRKTA